MVGTIKRAVIPTVCKFFTADPAWAFPAQEETTGCAVSTATIDELYFGSRDSMLVLKQRICWTLEGNKKVIYGDSYIVAMVFSTTRVWVNNNLPRERRSAECECSTDCGGETHFDIISNEKEVCVGVYRGNRATMVRFWFSVWNIGNLNGCTNFNF